MGHDIILVVGFGVEEHEPEPGDQSDTRRNSDIFSGISIPQCIFIVECGLVTVFDWNKINQPLFSLSHSLFRNLDIIDFIFFFFLQVGIDVVI